MSSYYCYCENLEVRKSIFLSAAFALMKGRITHMQIDNLLKKEKFLIINQTNDQKILFYSLHEIPNALKTECQEVSAFYMQEILGGQEITSAPKLKEFNWAKFENKEKWLDVINIAFRKNLIRLIDGNFEKSKVLVWRRWLNSEEGVVTYDDSQIKDNINIEEKNEITTEQFKLCILNHKDD